MRDPRVIAIIISAKRNHGCCADSYSEQHREKRRPQHASESRRWGQ
jgi:hypothetical protein